jgi:hypothetical protein
MNAAPRHTHSPTRSGSPFGAAIVAVSETAVARRLGDTVTVHSGGG